MKENRSLCSLSSMHTHIRVLCTANCLYDFSRTKCYNINFILFGIISSYNYTLTNININTHSNLHFYKLNLLYFTLIKHVSVMKYLMNQGLRIQPTTLFYSILKQLLNLFVKSTLNIWLVYFKMFFIPDKMLYKYNVNIFKIPDGKVCLIS